MKRLQVIFKFCSFQNFSLSVRCQKTTTVRYLSNVPSRKNESDNEVDPLKQDKLITKQDGYLSGFKVWNEYWAVRKARKGKKRVEKLQTAVDWLKYAQSIKSYPLRLSELLYTLRKSLEERQLREQQYLPGRVDTLKPDLAAAHFLLGRGGSVKFVGQSEWIGPKEHIKSVPRMYVPGIFVEGIKAESTNLYYEGLQNLAKLRHLRTLSLKGLPEVNDWCLDWISTEYSMTLTHLDISDCKRVTHRGLSCFYRFECLKHLNVSGLPDTPEMKVACLMLQDLFPELEIEGIHLEIPKKIDPVDEDTKDISKVSQ